MNPNRKIAVVRCSFFLLSSCCLALSVVNAQTVGSKVTFVSVDKLTYTGYVKEIQGNYYRIKYDGYDFEAWLTPGQFNVQSEGTAVADISTSLQALRDIYAFGKTQHWVTPVQDAIFNQYTAALSSDDQANLLFFLQKAQTASARFFVLKSLLAGDAFHTLEKFIQELNVMQETEQKEKCVITWQRSIIQQWQFSCSVTAVQVYLGDLSPRYTWEVKKVRNFDIAANDLQSNEMAVQQKQLLEYYGGIASPRGDESGRPIGILSPLNELVGPIIGVRFYAEKINEGLSVIFSRTRKQLDDGYLMPLLIEFEGSTAAHFILVMRYRYQQGACQFLVYDPWSGTCDYISEEDLSAGSLAPFNTTHRIRLSYYYPVVKLTQTEKDALQQGRKNRGF